jgi:hypothetical protein
VNLPLSPVLQLLSPEMARPPVDWSRLREWWPPHHGKSVIPILYADPVGRRQMARLEEALGMPPPVWWNAGFDGEGETP